MRLSLKRVEIFGFKSFAFKTRLDFASGINAIVGPNGCGKSNIADAFMWVLGEQKVKALRSSSMEDVIFSGSEKRKAHNLAEVHMTFDNAAAVFNLPFEEVCISRRLFRSGESEYLLNGRVCRLKDIQDLLVQAGLGREAFSIIGQGKVDVIVSQSPEERRSAFEEVAGISRFLQKRKEARKHLENTVQNLVRIRDVYGEVERQLHVLEDQKEIALKFRTYKQALTEQEQALFFLKAKEFSKRKQEMSIKLDSYSELISTASRKLHHIREFMDVSKQELKRLNDSYSEIQLKLHETVSKRKIAAQEKESVSRQQQNLIQATDQSTTEKKSIFSEYTHLKEELEAVEKKLHIEKEQSIQAQQHFDVAASKLKEIEQEYEGFHKHARHAHEKELQLQNERARFEKILIEYSAFIQHEHVREEETKKRLAEIYQRQEKMIEEEKETHKKKNTLEEQIQDLHAQIKNTKFDMEDLQKKKRQCDVQVEKVRRDLIEAQAQQKAHEKVKKNHTSHANILMREAENRQSPLYQNILRLADVMAYTSENITSILQIWSNAFIVPTKEILQIAVQFLQKHNVHHANFLCVEMLLSNQEYFFNKNTLALALKQHFQEKKSSIEKPEQGSFLDTLLYYDHSSLILYRTGSEEIQLVHEEKEFLQLESKIHALEIQLKNVEEERKGVVDKLYKAELACRTDEKALFEKELLLKTAIQDEQRLQKQKLILEKEIEQINISAKSYIATIQDKKAKADTAEKSKILLIQNLEELKNKRAQFENQVKEYEEKVRTYRIDREHAYTLYEEKKRTYTNLGHTHDILKIKMSDNEKQQTRIAVEQEKTARTRTYLERRAEELKIEFEVLSAEIERLTKEHTRFQEAKKVIDEKIAQSDTELQALYKQEAGLREEKARYSAELQNIEKALIDTVNECEVQFGIHPSDIVCTIDSSITISQIEKTIRELKKNLEKYAHVNMHAIEEYQEVYARYNELVTQLRDIEASKIEIEKMISELEEISRKQLIHTFEVVQTAFRENFSTLFSGGEADISLVGSSDILDAGIEIFARPPGKKMRSIQLMSGGEKCLTALALVFAFFSVRPKPFCILDEVDAPLDEANVDRFSMLLKRFSKESQLIVITHNKRTMAESDMLFGISMQEKGVSEVIPLEYQKITSSQSALVSSE